jgi:hypothetical protein
MTEQTIHQDNDTPTASIPEGDTQTQGAIENTPFLADGSTGGSLANGVRADVKWAGTGEGDPKSAGTPVHAAPTEESPQS